MKEYIDALQFEIETAGEVFEHWNVVSCWNYTVIENKYGGNPTLHIVFSYNAPQFDGREKVWNINPAFMSVEMFRNEIKAYMYDCVYGFISLLF